jgi:hypothetical protein
MSRNIIIIAIIGLLAACTTQGDGEPTDTSTGAAPSTAAVASADASADSTDAVAGTVSAACADAFAAVAEQDVSSLSAMGDLPEVEATIEQCESIADWTAGAAEVLGEEVNPATVQLLLDIRCQVPALGDTAVCEEVAAS